MTDPNASADPALANQSPAVSQTPAASGVPEGFVEKQRLDGALAKIQELTLANRLLTDQVTAKNAELGTLQAQFTQKEAEWGGQASEFTNKLATAETEKAGLSSKLTEHQLTAQKIQIITDLKRPELFSVLGLIPNDADPEVMKGKIQNLANFAAGVSQQREQALLAGVLPVIDANQVNALPTSEAGWQTYINSFPLGSPERQTAFDSWHAQLFQPKS